jgi:hypothetical protein
MNPLLKFPNMNSATIMMKKMLFRALHMFSQRKLKVYYCCQ